MKLRVIAVAVALLLLGFALGERVPEGFSFSGGSGRVRIACPAVFERDGRTFARLVFSSPNYPRLVSAGVEYAAEHDDGTSIFEIPVTVGVPMTVTATTTAMSVPHDIDYTICVDPEEPAAASEAPPPAATPAPEREPMSGLRWERQLPLRYAERFSVDYYEGGYALIDIVDGDRILVVPEGAAIPDGLPADVIPIQRPVKNIYLAATSAMALFDRLGALDAIGMSSLAAADWHVENARAAMEAGEIRFAGRYSEPDYELLLSAGCPLAIESTMIFHTPRVKEMLESLGIPVIVDRSSYEPHPLGRTEWIKLYAVLVGREAEAGAFFDARAAVIDACSDFPNTEKTVAFFYVSSDRSAVVRGAGDYVPRMIELAGGRYALSDVVEQDGSRASVSITMEQFYAAAVDADYLIYNAGVANPVESLDALRALSPLFDDFKAVKNGNVWRTGRDLYQETDDVGELISDIHNMLAGGGEMRFLTRLE